MKCGSLGYYVSFFNIRLSDPKCVSVKKMNSLMNEVFNNEEPYKHARSSIDNSILIGAYKWIKFKNSFKEKILNKTGGK